MDQFYNGVVLISHFLATTFLTILPVSFRYVRPNQVFQVWSKERLQFDTEDQVLSNVKLIK